jgi:enoyl-[acyl-carrier protein] reductase I
MQERHRRTVALHVRCAAPLHIPPLLYKPLPSPPQHKRREGERLTGVATTTPAQAGCEVILGTWVPALNIFETSLRRGKFDENRVLSDGSLMEFAAVLPMDAVFDTPEDVPEDVKTNKRYAGNEGCVPLPRPSS